MKQLMIMIVLLAGLRAKCQTLGNVADITSVTCPKGFARGASCSHLMIRACVGAIDLGVTIGTTTPPSPKGTIVLFTGSNGTRPTGGKFSTDYFKGSYRVVDVDWDSKPANGWPDTGISKKQPANILAGACRPATLLQYLSGLYPSQPFCAQGSSMGSSAIAYSVANYRVVPPVAVEFVPGPVTSEINAGCDSNAGEIEVNPTDGLSYQNSPQYEQNGLLQFAAAIAHYSGQPCPAATDNPNLTSQSVVQPGANLTWPTTFVGQWVCNPTSRIVNNSSAQSELLRDNLGPVSGSALTAVSNCQTSEDVQTGTTLEGVIGQVGIEQEMEMHCVAR